MQHSAVNTQSRTPPAAAHDPHPPQRPADIAPPCSSEDLSHSFPTSANWESPHKPVDDFRQRVRERRNSEERKSDPREREREEPERATKNTAESNTTRKTVSHGLTDPKDHEG